MNYRIQPIPEHIKVKIRCMTTEQLKEYRDKSISLCKEAWIELQRRGKNDQS